MDKTIKIGSRPIGELLKEARLSAGLTQKELCDRLGMEKSYIYAYEVGRRQPSIQTIAKIATGLGCELEITLRLKEDQPC